MWVTQLQTGTQGVIQAPPPPGISILAHSFLFSVWETTWKLINARRGIHQLHVNACGVCCVAHPTLGMTLWQKVRG